MLAHRRKRGRAASGLPLHAHAVIVFLCLKETADVTFWAGQRLGGRRSTQQPVQVRETINQDHGLCPSGSSRRKLLVTVSCELVTENSSGSRLQGLLRGPHELTGCWRLASQSQLRILQLPAGDLPPGSISTARLTGCVAQFYLLPTSPRFWLKRWRNRGAGRAAWQGGMLTLFAIISCAEERRASWCCLSRQQAMCFPCCCCCCAGTSISGSAGCGGNRGGTLAV